jgi:sugar/nucleoside kinase (ribokinase family)
MGSIIAIGTAVIDTVLHTDAVLDVGFCNKVTRSTADGGAIRNVAHNLSLLKDDVLFWAKFGNDTEALDMLTRIEMLGMQVHGKFIDLPTPHFYQLFSADTSMMISTTTADFYFDKTDLLPTFLVHDEKVGITDQDDSDFLKKLTGRSPEIRWVALGFLPPIELHEKFCAVFINKHEASRYADSVDAFFKLAFDFPLVVVTLDKEGLLYRTKHESLALPAPGLGKGNVLGMGDALVAGFMHEYLRGSPVTESLEFGINCAQKTSEVHTAINPQLAELLTK